MNGEFLLENEKDISSRTQTLSLLWVKATNTSLSWREKWWIIESYWVSWSEYAAQSVNFNNIVRIYTFLTVFSCTIFVVLKIGIALRTAFWRSRLRTNTFYTRLCFWNFFQDWSTTEGMSLNCLIHTVHDEPCSFSPGNHSFLMLSDCTTLTT